MRVTSSTLFDAFQNNLSEIQSRRTKADLQISTGKQIINLADSPIDVVDIKKYTAKINQSDSYQGILGQATKELYAVDNQLASISDIVQTTREKATESLQLGVQQNLPVLASYIKGYLGDAINQANTDFNGHFLLAGTKTTKDSLDKPAGSKTELPFEIIQGTPDANNPSGLKVIFKGNNADRTINKDPKTSEVINIKADAAFGPNGTQIFQSMIDVYNLLQFNKNGIIRTPDDKLNKEEQDKLNTLQKTLGNQYDELNRVTAKNGVTINRLDSIQTQMSSEQIRLKDFKSNIDDADVAKVAMDLKREETLLNYTLQVGSRISQNSLFDFLK